MTDTPSSDAGFAARQAAVQRWRRRSRVVGFWRTILPAAIVVTLLSIGGWIAARALVGEPTVPVPSTTEIQMTGPRFYGVDSRDRAFVLAAEKAVQETEGEHRITLTRPTFNLGGGRVRANEGVWIEDSTTIVLRGDVDMVNADGERMQTQEAQIDTRTGTITNRNAPGSGRVQIDSQAGQISADDYIISENGDVTFRGGVRGVINAR